MATIQGTNGNATIAGFDFKISGWSANLMVGDVETSGFIDAGNHTYEPVSVGMSGSASGTGTTGTDPTPPSLTGGTPALDTAKAAIVLTATTGCTYSFTGVVTNVKFDRRWDGKLDMSCDFKATGAITQVWDD